MLTNLILLQRGIIVCIGEKYVLPVCVDPEDVDWLVEMGGWIVTHGASGTKIGYAARTIYDPTTKTKILLFMHKLVLERAEGPPPTPAHRIGDHIDGDTLNNRKRNLRWATPQMNARNRFGFEAQQLRLL